MFWNRIRGHLCTFDCLVENFVILDIFRTFLAESLQIRYLQGRILPEFQIVSDAHYLLGLLFELQLKGNLTYLYLYQVLSEGISQTKTSVSHFSEISLQLTPGDWSGEAGQPVGYKYGQEREGGQLSSNKNNSYQVSSHPHTLTPVYQ